MFFVPQPILYHIVIDKSSSLVLGECKGICNIVVRDNPFVMFLWVMLRYDVMEKRVNVTKDVTL